MTFNIDVKKLPRKVLENAVELNDTIRKIYITLYCCGEPKIPQEIAKKLGYARTYVYMRLCQLEYMDLAKRVDEQRKVRFQAI